jgi:hypothetical protein
MRWRIRFGLPALFAAVAAVAIALAWFARANRFHDSPEVYAFQLATAEGRPLRGAVAFVLQNRLFPQYRRLQAVIFIDVQPDAFNRDVARANLEMQHIGSYASNGYGGWWIPDVASRRDRYSAIYIDRSDFGTGAMHEVAGIRRPDSDHWRTIVGGNFDLVAQIEPLSLTWEELLEFTGDPNVERWNGEAIRRWKAGRS